MSDLLGGASGNVPVTSPPNLSSSGASASSPYSGRERLSPGLRTPRDIMNQRQAREAAREARQRADAEAAEAEERRRLQMEDRRQSAERRAAAAMITGAQQRDSGYRSAAVSAGGHTPATGTYASPMSDAGGFAGVQGGSIYIRGDNQRRYSQPLEQSGRSNTSRSNNRADTARLPPQQSAQSPAHSGTQEQQASHRREAAASSSDAQPRRQQPRQTTTTPQPRADASTSSGDNTQQKASFPHAFERWETLSSHWEGLTSYWIHRMEQNNAEISRDPLAQQMSRQIIDLTAAGANLFHAVVELQRLRASSERKFQRWFYEVKAEQEKSQEVRMNLEARLRALQQQGTPQQQGQPEGSALLERSREEQEMNDRVLAQMRRELKISTDEARRAWEELGRREQEERDRIYSLKDGNPITIGGVQVVPTQGGHSRGPSLASGGGIQRRPPGAELSGQGMPPQLQTYQASVPVTAQGLQEFMLAPQDTSPTDTDPFTERPGHQARSSQGQAPISSPLDPRASGPIRSTSPTQTAIAARRATEFSSTSQGSIEAATTKPLPAAPFSEERIRRQSQSRSPAQAVHSSTLETERQPLGQQAGSSQHARSVSATAAASRTAEPSSETEHADDEDDEGHELGDRGNVRLDTQGRSVSLRSQHDTRIASTPFRRTETQSQAPQIPEDVIRSHDSFEQTTTFPRHVMEQYQRPLEIRPGPYQPQPHRQQAYPQSTQPAATSHAQTTLSPAAPTAADYEGMGYGDDGDDEPQAATSSSAHESTLPQSQQRHHHPTRLSDVLEEEEEEKRRSRAASTGGGAPHGQGS